MRSQRTALIALLVLLAVFAAWLIRGLSTQAAEAVAETTTTDEPAPKPPRAGEDAQKPAEETAPATRRASGQSDSVEQRVAPLGPPVKIFGWITDEDAHPLAEVQLLVHDARTTKHKPEVLREGYYECTLHERGRALVVAEHEGSCKCEVPFEVMERDVERRIDVVLPRHREVRVRLRDLEGKPFPRFPKSQPLHAELRAVASIEELPALLPAHAVKLLPDGTESQALGWGVFEAENPMHSLNEYADAKVTKATGDPREARKESRRRRKLRGDALRDFNGSLADIDEEQFEQAIKRVKGNFKRRSELQDLPKEEDPERMFLTALGYIGDDGRLVEGESPQRDVIGTLELDRPLPLRVSLLAGHTVIESRELVPTTEDLTFKVDFKRLEASYVHAWLFVSDSKTGARIGRARANLHVDPLSGWFSADDLKAAGNPDPGPNRFAGQEAPDMLGLAKGWRFPDSDVYTDADGRVEFLAATPGWWRLTVDEPGHVPMAKWVFVPRAPECDLGFFELAPLATSNLRVTDEAGKPVRVSFVVRPLLHAKEREGSLERWYFSSDGAGELHLKDVGLQYLLLRSVDTQSAVAPIVLDNTLGIVKGDVLHAHPARHVLVHLPASLPWSSIVSVVSFDNQPVHEEGFGGRTLIDLWVADGTYTLQVLDGATTLLSTKFEIAGASQLIELVR